MKNNVDKKNFVWNFLGTSFNAFNSLFFLIIVTRINGESEAGIFTLSFSLACLFCIIGGYAGRVFQVTDVKKEFNDKEYIIHKCLTCLIMIIIVFGYLIIKGYDYHKFMITFLLCFMKCTEVFADVFYGILQKNNQLYKVGISLVLKSSLSVGCFLVINYLLKDLIISCFLLCLIWVIILAIYDIPSTLKWINRSEVVSKKNVLKLFKSGFFAFSILFLAMYLINAPRYALDGRVSENLQAVYGIILMPATVISLFAQYMLQPFLNKLSFYFKVDDKQSFNKLVFFIMSSIAIVGLISLIVTYFLGIPVLTIIYNVNLKGYLPHLLLIITGASFYAGGTLFSTALTTVRYTFVQFIIYSTTSLFAMFISILLIKSNGLYGASLAYFIIMGLQFILYIIFYITIMNKKKLWNRGERVG